ncbi:PEP-CTERM sorting domain-containing protein [Planctomycetales bacterium ZRK34]|nr:PEP-CTERM sorting domain-containing protein [Planctomycetales bacterium ZRK34]
MKSNLFTVTVALMLIAAAAGDAPAASVAFQAEDFISTTDGSSGPGFTVVSDLSAFYEQGATTLGDTTSSPPTHLATYSLTFDTAGTYYLYLRFVTDTQGNDPGNSSGNLSDSLYIAADFGSSPASFTNINGLADVSSPNVYDWASLSTWSGHASSDTGSTYTVAAPGTLSFVIGGREGGLTLDAFVFSTDGNLSHSALNLLVVPEPSTAALFGLASLVMLRRRL